jgi:hypothetical protein
VGRLILIGRIQTLVASAVFALATTASAHAATITYTNAETTPAMQLVIDDDAVENGFRFSLSTTMGAADYLGLAFDFSGLSLSQENIVLVSATNASDQAIAPALTLYGNNTGSQNDCGNGCNFNGSGSATLFDYIIGIGAQGGNSANFVKSVVFDIFFAGSLDDNPFSQLAARAQSTTNPGGSIKTSLTPEMSPVPLPAGLPLLLSGLLAAGLLARRRMV